MHRSGNVPGQNEAMRAWRVVLTSVVVHAAAFAIVAIVEIVQSEYHPGAAARTSSRASVVTAVVPPAVIEVAFFVEPPLVATSASLARVLERW